MSYDAWLIRERKKVSDIELYIAESVALLGDDEDQNKIILSTLLMVLLDEVEAYLKHEYVDAYVYVYGDTPTPYDIDMSVYRETLGLDFSERLEAYIDEATERVDIGDHLLKQIETLIITDGHRVRCEAEQAAGEALSTVESNVTKTWVSMDDDDVRATHRILHGTTIGINEYFYTANGKALHPGGFSNPEEDVHCRCFLKINVK